MTGKLHVGLELQKSPIASQYQHRFVPGRRRDRAPGRRNRRVRCGGEGESVAAAVRCFKKQSRIATQCPTTHRDRVAISRSGRGGAFSCRPQGVRDLPALWSAQSLRAIRMSFLRWFVAIGLRGQRGGDPYRSAPATRHSTLCWICSFSVNNVLAEYTQRYAADCAPVG